MSEEKKVMKGDMTVGNPVKLMLKFSIPMIVGNLFQQFYNLADTMMVGRMIDSDALAAVGASFAITMLFIMFAVGTGIGCSVVISQLFGGKQIEKMKTAISTAVITVFGFAIFMSVVGRVLSHWILVWMQTPERILPAAETYLNIYFYGFVFLFMYNMFNAIFNALGASKIPLIFLICSSLLNIGLDYFMIQSMGIAGAAWATLIAQAIAAIGSFIVLYIKIKKIPSEHHKFYDWSLMKKMITIAIPSVIQQSLVSIGMLLIQAAVNASGEVVMAGYTAAGRIDGIAIVPLVNIGNAVSTFAAQNLGAKKPERAKQGLHVGIVMGVVIGLVIAVILFFFGENFIAAFMDKGEDIAGSIEYGTTYLGVVSLFYFLFGIMNCCGSILRGAGDMKFFMAQTFVNLAVRVIITYSLLGVFGAYIIMWAMPISWMCSTALSFFRYRSGKWMEKKLI